MLVPANSSKEICSTNFICGSSFIHINKLFLMINSTCPIQKVVKFLIFHLPLHIGYFLIKGTKGPRHFFAKMNNGFYLKA